MHFQVKVLFGANLSLLDLAKNLGKAFVGLPHSLKSVDTATEDCTDTVETDVPGIAEQTHGGLFHGLTNLGSTAEDTTEKIWTVTQSTGTGIFSRFTGGGVSEVVTGGGGSGDFTSSRTTDYSASEGLFSRFIEKAVKGSESESSGDGGGGYFGGSGGVFGGGGGVFRGGGEAAPQSGGYLSGLFNYIGQEEEKKREIGGGGAMEGGGSPFIVWVFHFLLIALFLYFYRKGSLHRCRIPR